MPLAVINCVNLLGHAKRSLLVFTDRHGQIIGDYTPTAGKTDDTDASVLSAVNDFYSPVLPVPSEMPGVFSGEEGSADELPGVEAHDDAIISKPTGVDLGGSQPEPPQVEAGFDNAALIRQLMVVSNNKLLLKSMRLRLLRWRWWLAMLVLGTR